MPTLMVLVHGGQHTRHCWSPTLDEMHTLAQERNLALRTLAVNLPGRGSEPGNLADLGIQQATASVLHQIEAFEPGANDIILVGHSMAGVTLPGVAAALGRDRVREVVFLACCVPPQGKAIIDTLRPPISWVTALLMRNRQFSKPMPIPVAKWLFTNGANHQQHQIMIDSLCDESILLAQQPVDRRGFTGFKTRWILTERDRSLSPKLQRRFIANLGGVGRVENLDTCHNAMITEPHALAMRLIADLVS